jgi:hypothetical protein
MENAILVPSSSNGDTVVVRIYSGYLKKKKKKKKFWIPSLLALLIIP